MCQLNIVPVGNDQELVVQFSVRVDDGSGRSMIGVDTSTILVLYSENVLGSSSTMMMTRSAMLLRSIWRSSNSMSTSPRAGS